MNKKLLVVFPLSVLCFCLQIKAASLADYATQCHNYHDPQGIMLQKAYQQFDDALKQYKATPDVAHKLTSYMLIFTQAFLETHPNGLIIQINGFNAKNADMILSAGTRQPTETIKKLAMCLKQNVSPHILIFPTQTQKSGALNNTIGQCVNDYCLGGFVHIEISHSMRDRLTSDDNLLRKFSQCLEQLS